MRRLIFLISIFFLGSLSPVLAAELNFQVDQSQITKGSEFTVNVMIDNAATNPIDSAQGWFSFDPQVLEFVSIAKTSDFDFIAPGENTASNGLVKLGRALLEKSALTQKQILLAKIKMRVLKVQDQIKLKFDPANTNVNMIDTDLNVQDILTAANNLDLASVAPQITKFVPLVAPVATTTPSIPAVPATATTIIPISTVQPQVDVIESSPVVDLGLIKQFQAQDQALNTIDPIKVVTNMIIPPTTLRPAPQISFLEFNDNDLRIVWVPESNVAGYYVYFSPVSDRMFKKVRVASPNNSLRIGNIVLGATYYIQITSFDDLGVESALSTQKSLQFIKGARHSFTLKAAAPIIDVFSSDLQVIKDQERQKPQIAKLVNSGSNTLVWILLALIMTTFIVFIWNFDKNK